MQLTDLFSTGLKRLGHCSKCPVFLAAATSLLRPGHGLGTTRSNQNRVPLSCACAQCPEASSQVPPSITCWTNMHTREASVVEQPLKFLFHLAFINSAWFCSTFLNRPLFVLPRLCFCPGLETSQSIIETKQQTCARAASPLYIPLIPLSILERASGST